MLSVTVRKQGIEIRRAARRRVEQLQEQIAHWRCYVYSEQVDSDEDIAAARRHMRWLECEVRRLRRVVVEIDDRRSYDLTLYELLNYGFGIPLEEVEDCNAA